MKYNRYLMIVVFMAFKAVIFAQDLSDHLWKDRLLLVYTKDDNSEMYIQQIDELIEDREELDDRKLVLYRLTATHMKKGWENKKWEGRNNFLNHLFEAHKDFEVVLIGLDGSVKLRQDQLLTRKKLYATIDVMPMRQREIRNR